MAYDENTVAYGNPDLMAQEEALALRKQRLQAAARAAAEQSGIYAPAKPDNSEVGGFTLSTGQRIPGQVLRTPAAAMASPIIAGLGDAVAQHAYTDDLSGFNRMQGQAAQEHLAQRPADNATESDKLAWAQKGAQIPALRNTMADYVKDQIIQQPVRQEAREARQAERDATRAESQRKQADELAYRRQRDEDAAQLRRDLAADSNSLRRDLTSAIHSSGGGGKASDFQIVQDNEGNLTRVNKLSGEVMPLGAGGKSSAQNQKDALETRNQIERSSNAISSAPQVSKLIDQSTGSTAGTAIDALGRSVGYATQGAKAIKQLEPLADVYLKSVPRFEGPQSDKDTASYKAAAGDLANPNLTRGERQAALKIVVQLHQKSVKQMQGRGNQSGGASGNWDAVPGSDMLKKPKSGGGGGWSVEPVQ